jgi:hypothetical protein
MKKLSFILIILCSLLVNGQEKTDPPKFGISFSGFVKTDVFYDTRQTVYIREGHFLLYPDAINLDLLGNDLNDKSSFNMLSIQTRLKGAISGPDAFGAKTMGVIEADFFGNAGSGLDDVNGFRLRHAFAKLSWSKTELLIGQYWHPMFIAESFPDVISFNTGSPFQPFSRNPQIRLTYTTGITSLIAAAYTQRDFQGIGPDGASSKYQRNSGLPTAHLQLQLKPAGGHLFGAGIEYKVVKPELFTIVNSNQKYISNEKLTSLSVISFIKLKFKPIIIKAEGIYAQNAYDLVMLGGYAVKEITNPANGTRSFTNLNTLAYWIDFSTTGEKIKAGLFIGHTKNLGANDAIVGDIYARGSSIDKVDRIAPRILYLSGKMTFALEQEFTRAHYGTANGDQMGGVTATKAVTNSRTLLSCIYSF